MKVFILLSILTISACSQADEPKRLVTVSGQCIKQVQPDKMKVQLNIVHLDKNASVASAKTHDLNNKLNKKIKSLDLKDLELNTTNYNLHEKHQWKNNSQVSLGFEATLGLEVSTSQKNRIGEIIKIANEYGVANIGSLTSYISTTQRQQLERECLKIAGADAKEKAIQLVQNLGAKVGDLISIQESGTSAPSPMPIMRPMMKMQRAEMSAPDINTKDHEFVLSITAQFEII